MNPTRVQPALLKLGTALAGMVAVAVIVACNGGSALGRSRDVAPVPLPPAATIQVGDTSECTRAWEIESREPLSIGDDEDPFDPSSPDTPHLPKSSPP